MSALHKGGAGMPRLDGMRVSLRMADGAERTDLEVEALPRFGADVLAPWRIPKSYKRQSHKPSYYWVSQTRDFVLCESRLEMRVLQQIDFEEDVNAVLPQPLLLTFRVNGKLAHHTPDFLIWRPKGRLLVNVKPLKFQSKEANVNSFAACDAVAERLGWRHRVYGEPQASLLSNLRWLGGYRRQPFMFHEIAHALLARLARGPLPFCEWIKPIGDNAICRPVAFHLMWRSEVRFDCNLLLNDKTLVSLGAV